jgi:hypothetical protein
MKKDSISDGLLKMPWADLAGILVTKDDLRGSGWSEAKIKLYLGEPKGRHPSTHFRNPLGQPYWTGQQVLAAAVRAGLLPSDVKQWPYARPVHGLTHDGQFLLGHSEGGILVMHPGLESALLTLLKAKRELVDKCNLYPQLGQRNMLANPEQTFGEMMVKVFSLKERAFPPTIPAEECIDKVLWMNGTPQSQREEIEAFAHEQRLLAELQCLSGAEDVIEALAEDIATKEHRYEELGTSVLAELCGIEPADGDASRTTYAYWLDLDSFDQHHETMAEMEPYLSPYRWQRFERWIEKIEEGELEFEDLNLTSREVEIIELLHNQDGYEDRAYLAVCTHCLKSRKGLPVNFQYFVGDGGVIEDSSGPYHFSEPEGINCDEDITHPKTGKRLADLRYKPRKPKSR